MARLCHRLFRLSVPPNSVVKCVKSISTMSPERRPVRRHPDQRVELRVALRSEPMRSVRVDALRVLGKQRVDPNPPHPSGGIQISALNSVLPSAVNGCGRFGSTRCFPSTRRASLSGAVSLSVAGAGGN